MWAAALILQTQCEYFWEGCSVGLVEECGGGYAVPGRNVHLLDSLAGDSEAKPGVAPVVSLCFAIEPKSAILKIALLTGFYKLISVYLPHQSSQFITPLVRIQPSLFPHHMHINTGSFSSFSNCTDFCFILEFDAKVAKCLLKLRSIELI